MVQASRLLFSAGGTPAPQERLLTWSFAAFVPAHSRKRGKMAAESPVVLVKWYDVVKWFLERVDSFPKNQRFVFGQRLADRAIDVLELLVEAAYSPRKADLLSRANRDIEVLRWLVRPAKDRGLFTMRQYGFAWLLMKAVEPVLFMTSTLAADPALTV